MKYGPTLPAVVFGVLVGWMAHAFMGEGRLTAGEALGAAVTIGVGWWIQRALGRQSELDRVPLDRLSRLCQQIDLLITRCLDRPAETLGTDPDLVQTVRLLSNEVLWVHSLVTALSVESDQAQQLLTKYFAFKRKLTVNRKVDLSAAAGIGRDMRTHAFIMEWHVCRRILDEPTDIDVLAKTLTQRSNH